MKRHWTLGSVLVLGTLLAVGCGQSPRDEATTAGPPAAADTTYLLTDEPAGAKEVREARQASKDGEEVVVVGRIGGDVDPFVEGVAAFTLVDRSLQPCVDGCPTPWDYCCDLDTLPENQAMVKVVDAQGAPVAQDARTLLGVEPLSSVVVRGKAKRDDAGNLTVLADRVYVKP